MCMHFAAKEGDYKELSELHPRMVKPWVYLLWVKAGDSPYSVHGTSYRTLAKLCLILMW